MKRRLPVLLSILFLYVFATAQSTADEVIRVDTALVSIPVIVSDRENRYIPGLTVADFKVFQDGVDQKIEVFTNEEAPMNIVVALDTSLSTIGVLKEIKKAAKDFIKVLTPGDRAMIVSVDNNFEVLSDLTADKRILQKAIKDAEIGDRAGTVIYDALFELINKQLRNVKGRKAIILLTDGKDHGSYITKRELLAELNESDTVIYPVFYETMELLQRRRRQDARSRFPGRGGIGGMGRGGGGMGRPGGGRGPGNAPPGGRNRPNIERENEYALEFLQQVADSTSGRLFQEKIADLSDVFRQIADELKRQYLVGFYPPENITPGTVHKIKVQVTRPGSVIRAKTTYTSQPK